MSSKEVRLSDMNEVFAIINERLKLSDPMGASLDSCVSITELLSILSNAPTIDPESLRPKGKWEWLGPYRGNNEGYIGTCPVCKKRMRLFELNYCPNCGAKMEVYNV